MEYTLILASSSPYRKQQLETLRLDFLTDSPDIDESPKPNETPQQLAARLAEQKAKAVALRQPADTTRRLIIGSDQVATCKEQLIAKPGNHERAREQLTLASGSCVHFYTGLSLFDSDTGTYQTSVTPCNVHFRKLNEKQIERYLQTETPYDCAGSFKSEGLGVSLFERIETPDPSSLTGLPLIGLCTMLNRAGICVP